ncbi:MAG: YlmC/YmxH family sporulation protein [Traorella sp.]
MKLSEFMSKRVISVVDGKDIGHVSDAEMTKELKMICLIVCMRRKGFARLCPFLFEPECEKIPVDCIVNIGIDVILVKRTS